MLHFTEVLTQLDNREYCSGQRLAKRFNVTRATIHNCIVKIEALGISIERVRGLGYRLAQPLDLLNPEDIKSKLALPVGSKLSDFQCLQEVDSTNRYATDLALPPAGKFSAVLAELQSLGKGRRGRPWISPYAANIYLSVLWPLQRPMHEAGRLSPMIAISMLLALEELGITGLGVKWPNDIYSEEKKLAGLLIECSGEINGGCRMVVGIGVNVLMSQIDNIEIDQQWTDIKSCTQDWQFTRNDVAAAMINNVSSMLDQFENDTFNNLADAWSRWDVMKNKAVDLHSAHSIKSGIARGIDMSGCLLLETSNGIEKISAGDVSLRASI